MEESPYDDEIIISLDERAIMLHELFSSFIQAGFTEDQAISLLARIVVNDG